jgi:hypothetical protein
MLGWAAHPLVLIPRLLLHLSLGHVAVIAGAATALAWYQYGRPTVPKPPVPKTLSEAVGLAVAEVPPAMPRPRVALRPTLVLPLVGDRDLLVTQALRDALAAQGWYSPVEAAPTDKMLDQLFQAIRLPRQPVEKRAVAAKLAKAAGAEVAVLGRVKQMELFQEHADVSIHIEAFEVEDEQTLLAGAYPRPVLQQPVMGPAGPWGPILAVAAFALLWPPIASPIMRRILKLESNTATAAALMVLTAVPAMIAWPVIFGSSGGTWRLVSYIVGVLLVGLWCTAVFSWVAERDR